jgi:hypothetical protein
LKSRAPAETAPRQLSETSPPTNETRRPPLDAGALNRRPPAVERAEPYTDSGTRHTSASCYDRPVRNPPYLIQISTSQRKSALLRRRVSAREVQRTEIRESGIKGRGTRHEKPPNRSLTRCQTADRPRRQAGTRCKRRASSRPFQRHLDRRFYPPTKNSTAEKPTKNRPFSAEKSPLRRCQQQGRATSVGTSPIHKDPGCRAPNERCDNRSGPVVRKSTMEARENVTFRARYLENGATEAFRVRGRPIESRGRPIERRRRLRPRTSPKGRNPIPGPPQKAKIGRKIAADRRRKGARRRPRAGIAKGRRGKRPTSKRRGGGPGGPPARKNSKFRAAETAVKDRHYRHARRSSQSAPEAHRRRQRTESQQPTEEVRRRRAAIDSAHRRRRKRVQRATARHRRAAPIGKTENFRYLRTKPFRSSEGHQTWQKRPSPPYDPKSEDGATKSPSVPELGEVENLGAPSPTRKPKVGSTSDRCQTKGPGHGSQLPKFEADRTDGFRDTGVRKFTPN